MRKITTISCIKIHTPYFFRCSDAFGPSSSLGGRTITGVYEYPDERETEFSVSFSFALFLSSLPSSSPLPSVSGKIKFNSSSFFFPLFRLKITFIL